MATRLLAKEHAAFDPLMTAEEAAQYLSVHTETILRYARQRAISCVKARGTTARVKFRLSVLNQWIRANERPASRLAQA